MRIPVLMISLLLFSILLQSQPITQTVRGKVNDAASKTGLPGANVVIVNSSPFLGATTAPDGTFIIQKVPVGRQTIQVSYMGYKTVILPEIMVSSGKEAVLNIDLEEMAVTAREVEIKATVNKDRPINTMAMVSSRSFSVDESRRYAGSADDPMRAVSNFAGVAGSADVNSNQIVIRGNSPKGLLWRVDGVDIPNPNHYAYVGSSGGGLTMFSSQVLSNSDFYTAAFPAQFGNALSGVFDMRFRNGNNARHEFAVQVGIQGLDVAAEGPFSKKYSGSFLFNYRYSILGFLQLIDPAMKNKVPQYQDLSLKVNLPTKRAGTFTLIGIGGISRSQFYPEKDSTKWETLEDRTQSVLNNNMAALALTHRINVSRKSFLNSYLSATYSDIYFNNNYLVSNYELQPQENVNHVNYRVSGNVSLNTKFSQRHVNRSGIQYTSMFYDMQMEALNPFTGVYGEVDNGKGNTDLIQAFTESKFEISNNLSLTGGLRFQYFLLNDHYSVEPRAAARWQFKPKQALSLGFGIHSQIEDAGVYLADVAVNPELEVKPNRNLGLSKAFHAVAGYDLSIRPDLRFKAEAYYQYLYEVPVMPGNYYSLINSMGGYYNDTLVNEGTGRNFGIDLTFEKFLTKQYYYLVTVSLFDSKYVGGDQIERNTRFNSNYVVNLLGGKEWTVRKKNIFGVNLKATVNGGEYYVPIDLEQSIAEHRQVADESRAYDLRLPEFFYLDLTLTYRTNHKKFSGIWAIQVKNLLNQKPDLGYVYNDFNQSIEPVMSMGILPFISYKIEF
jgi:hypothetical protein